MAKGREDDRKQDGMTRAKENWNVFLVELYQTDNDCTIAHFETDMRKSALCCRKKLI